MSRPRSFLLLCLYGLLCSIEWLCSKARERIEHLIFQEEPPPMIEARQVGGCFGPFHVFVDNVSVCRVEYAWSVIASDYAATKARAEHIAEALRHYQQSQEGVKVL